jgi:transcriptional regulator NrdR family protein
MVVDIESNLLQNYGSEIESSLIGQLVLNELMDLDKVSYIRFSSVYRNFEDENSFVNEKDKIKNEGIIVDKKQMELFPDDKKQIKRNGVNVNGSNRKN